VPRARFCSWAGSHLPFGPPKPNGKKLAAQLAKNMSNIVGISKKKKSVCIVGSKKKCLYRIFFMDEDTPFPKKIKIKNWQK
jgi:hypothetical protein